MKKSALVISFLVLAATSCTFSFPSNGRSRIFGKIGMSGVDTTVVYANIPTDYEELEVSGAFSVIYSPSAEHVTVKVDKNFVPYLDIRLDGNELELGAKVSSWENVKAPEVVIPVSSRGLKSIDMSGATKFVSEVVMEGYKLEMDLSGASKVDVRLNVSELEVDASGASKLILGGKAKRVELDCSGATKVTSHDGECLVADEVELDCSGAGKIEGLAGGRIYGDMSGASKVVVHKGSDVSGLSCSGASKITVEN